MTDLQRKFIEETGASFDGIPINGLHLEYITWLEAQIKALSIRDVRRGSELLPFSFIEWYSGMERQKILNAYERWKREKCNSSLTDIKKQVCEECGKDDMNMVVCFECRSHRNDDLKY